jgi:hypothetical protein
MQFGQRSEDRSTVNSPDPSKSTRTTPGPELTARQRAGNRFGVVSVVFALLAGLCSAVAALRPMAWAFAPIGLALGGTGVALWLNGRATNRDDAIIGAGLSFLVIMVLLFQLAATFPPMPIAPMP